MTDWQGGPRAEGSWGSALGNVAGAAGVVLVTLGLWALFGRVLDPWLLLVLVLVVTVAGAARLACVRASRGAGRP